MVTHHAMYCTCTSWLKASPEKHANPMSYCMASNFQGAQFLWISLLKDFRETIFTDGIKKSDKMADWLYARLWES